MEGGDRVTGVVDGVDVRQRICIALNWAYNRPRMIYKMNARHLT